MSLKKLTVNHFDTDDADTRNCILSRVLGNLVVEIDVLRADEKDQTTKTEFIQNRLENSVFLNQ